MFKNIKKLSECTLLSERLVYEDVPSKAPGTSSEKEPSDAEKARAALMGDVDTLVFAREEQVLKLLSGTDAYRQGDWKELNKLFNKEFEGFGVNEKSAERLLKKFQKEAFEYLGLTGDPLAVIDGRLGIYSLYAFALKTNLQWPKGDVPAGCPRLKALIDKDVKKAYENYQNYPFAKAVKQAEFAKMYTRIKTTNRRFMAERANLGQWALALWYAGAGLDGTAERIKFPKMNIFNDKEYYNAPGIALTLKLPGYTQPVLVDTEGRLLLYNKDTKEYLTIHYEYDVFPMTSEEKTEPEPKPEKKAPAKPETPPASPVKPKDKKPTSPDLVAEGSEKDPNAVKNSFFGPVTTDGSPRLVLRRMNDGRWLDVSDARVNTAEAIPKTATNVLADEIYVLKDEKNKEYYFRKDGTEVEVHQDREDKKVYYLRLSNGEWINNSGAPVETAQILPRIASLIHSTGGEVTHYSVLEGDEEILYSAEGKEVQNASA